MRKISLIITVVLIVFAIIFTIAPLEKYGVVLGILSAGLAFFALKKSDSDNQNFPKLLMTIASLIAVISLCFVLFSDDTEVVIDPEFEKEKIESAKQDKKDLEDLDGL